jgi:hypothetical protein
MHLLGIPKPRPRLKNWYIFVVLAATILALAVVALGNILF